MSNRNLSLSKTVSLVILVLVGAFAGYGCAQESEVETTPALSNSELQSAIEARLDSDEALRNADLDVDADASINRATISGTVPTEALRTRAIQLAESANSGLTIEARIDVKPPDVARSEWTEEYARAASTKARETGDSVTDSLDDTWIHTKIVTKLIGDTDTPARKINVDVKDKIVTLRGTVTTDTEKAEAARIARETEGVVRVVNQLKVSES